MNYILSIHLHRIFTPGRNPSGIKGEGWHSYSILITGLYKSALCPSPEERLPTTVNSFYTLTSYSYSKGGPLQGSRARDGILTLLTLQAFMNHHTAPTYRVTTLYHRNLSLRLDTDIWNLIDNWSLVIGT